MNQTATMSTADALVAAARAGDETALGALLESYYSYTLVLARVQIGRRLQSKVDAADLVQETFLEAHRNFPLFRGQGAAEFTAWLRQILAGRLANLIRRYIGTQGRDVRLERDLAVDLDHSSQLLDRGLASPVSSPSRQAARREQAVILADALARLPDNYREVIILRHLEGLTFPEVARRMGRSVDSVEKLWVRGLTRLRQTLVVGEP
jgi:RNA polymerase sigma-70 factor (ECF subfamily)